MPSSAHRLRPAHRLLSIVILALWMAPGAGALGIGAHLALEHHGPYDASGHAADLSELARAVGHGHHHDADAQPGHEPAARFQEASTVSRADRSCGALELPATSRLASLADRSEPDRPPRRASPPALPTAHAPLLL